MRQILLALMASALSAADVTRADVDAAGKVYADTVIAYYAALLAKAPKAVPVKITDDSTIKQQREAAKVNADVDAHEYIANQLRHAQKDKRPWMLPMRIAQMDYAMYEGDRRESVQRVLGLPAR